MRLSEKLDQLESQARWLEYLIDGLRESLYLRGLWDASQSRYAKMLDDNVKGDDLKEMGYIMDGYMHAYELKTRWLADALVRTELSGVELMSGFRKELEEVNQLYKYEQKILAENGDVEE